MHDNLNGHFLQQESWKYILRVVEDETIFFKTKLSRVLANDLEKSHLNDLEIFQHRFLMMDEQVVLLRHEVRELQEIIQQQAVATPLPASIITQQQGVALKIERLQQSFNELASDFSSYLHQSFT
ncbi:hypothetical protein HGH93_19680 [Chitinophaga polysaccharea]|uniref:hypothetical protein n=1 Tax=Chitinophaga TaxID=79328 RepID=UPI0014550178|nr:MULTISPECIES: hypothetical protein [Chitinophaga]NLR60342.1 hypothetical protein [Chitinophaga polysaccharea]NLU95983.1 hypothetical protein [Chitinophaga sp. Ak27]